MSIADLRIMADKAGDALTDEELQELFNEVDEDGDGLLSKEEFLNFICQ